MQRALSPVAMVLSDPPALGDGAAQRRSRLAQLQSTRSVEDVMAVVPGDYVPTLRPALMEVAAIQAKLSQSRDVLVKWDVLKAAGKYPTFLNSAAPSVQLTKEYKEQAAGLAHKSGIESAHKAHLDATFVAAVAAKHDEIMFLEKVLKPDQLYSRLRPLVEHRLSKLSSNSKLPDLESDGN
ncbi:hypothetical protein M0805_002841, partial [Coniferiporia weirii]